MGVTMTPPLGDLKAEMLRQARLHTQRVIKSLQFIGEDIVNQIRDGKLSNWNDQTGNLRSSTGYIITVDGMVVSESSFPVVREGGDGSSTGRSFAKALASLHPTGIALIVVAGMEYASYVEAMDNKAVIAGAEVQARTLVEKMLMELNQRYANYD